MIEKLLLPAIKLMERLHYPRKFGLIFVIVLIPLMSLSVSLISTIDREIRHLENERKGLAYINAIRQPIEHIQQHRGMTHAYLNGYRNFQQRILNIRPVIDGYLVALMELDQNLDVDFGMTDQIATLNRQWNAIKTHSLNQLPVSALNIHNDILASMINLIGAIADASGMTLDSKLDTYYLGDAVARSLPQMIENMGMARAVGVGVASKRAHTQQSYIELSILSNKIDTDAKRSSVALLAVNKVNPQLSAELSSFVLFNDRAISNIRSLLTSILLDADTVSIDSNIVFDTATAAITGSYGLYDAIAVKMDRLLQQRIESAREIKSLTLIVVIMVLVLVVYLFVGFYFSVIKSINIIGLTTRQVARGDLNTRLTLTTADELKQIAVDFNSMMTQRQQAEEISREGGRRIRDLLDSTAEAIFGLDNRGICTFVNTSCLRMLGYTHAREIVGRRMNELSHFYPHEIPLSEKKESAILRSFLMGNRVHLDTEFLWRTDGSSFPVDYRSHPIRREAEVVGAVVTFMDITERKKQEAHILHQAHFDSLTQLPNRFLSLDRLSQLIRVAERSEGKIAVLFLDLDDFKKINDTLGHETGDNVLTMTAERLRGALRNGDTVGRLGGDEFIVLLGGLTKAEDALPVVKNITNQFCDPFIIDGRELMLTTSIGISIYPGDGKTPSELLRNADAAMYYSKDHGRNTHSCFTESMNLVIVRRLALEEQLHGALERGEFEVVYQPQIAIENGVTNSAEALLRWHSSALGDISPSEFIPIAEHTGLIVPLGEFVLDQALAMVANCQQQYLSDFRIAVNISPRQVRDRNLVGFIRDTLLKSGLTSNSLELEITEGMLMSGHAEIDETMSAFEQLGVSIAMDDFGTGYSSLNYLRTYPFDVLKIDRSFIKDITEGPANKELINTIISMGHGLGLRVVAEGVETNDQFESLKALGCDYAQGYLFSKPMKKKEFLEWITKKSINNKQKEFVAKPSRHRFFMDKPSEKVTIQLKKL